MKLECMDVMCRVVNASHEREERKEEEGERQRHIEIREWGDFRFQ